MAGTDEERRLIYDAMNDFTKNGHCITTERLAIFIKTKHGKDINMDVIAEVQREQTKNIARRLNK